VAQLPLAPMLLGIGTPRFVVHCSRNKEASMHPVFWPMQAVVFWMEVAMLPWKMIMAPVADTMNTAAAATHPAATVGLDIPTPNEIGTSATDFRRDDNALH
jgi:hypothetical protein